MEILAKELLDKEIIFQSDLERLIGKRPFERETTYEAYTKRSEAKELKEKEADDAKKALALKMAEEKKAKDAAKVKDKSGSEEKPSNGKPKNEDTESSIKK